MMQARQAILRQHRQCLQLLTRVGMPTSHQPAQLCFRHFAAEAMSASKAPCSENYVKEAIKRMMLERDVEDEKTPKKPIGDQELERRFQLFQNLCKEAQLCIADCADAADNFDEEEQAAKSAVKNVYNEYVELLEDLRRASEEQLLLYSDARLENASNVKLLIQELEKIRRAPSVDSNV